MRRDPRAIITAHRMDPARRTLYLEGPSDRVFLRWLTKNAISPNAMILTIDQVDMPGHAHGGERARLLAFAAIVEPEQVQIRFLADADTDRLRGRRMPSNVWLTDTRDMEGYLLREECFEKMLRLGLEDESVDPRRLLEQILSIGRWLGILRLTSDDEGLNLPFQRTDMWRSLSCSRGQTDLTMDRERYISALLQNAGRNQRELGQITTRTDDKARQLAEVPDHELIHGKDMTILLEKALQAHGVHREDAIRILRTSFERLLVSDYPVLGEVLAYLS